MTLHAYCRKRGCGARLVASTDGNGGIVVTCEPCARNKAGRCRERPAPLASKRARRCPKCKAARHKETQRHHYEANRDRILAQQKEYAQRPEVRARRKAYKDQYNAEYFGDPVGRRAHVEATKRWRRSPKGREKELAAKRRHYRKHRDEILAQRKARYQANREAELAAQRARRRQQRAA